MTLSLKPINDPQASSGCSGVWTPLPGLSRAKRAERRSNGSKIDAGILSALLSAILHLSVAQRQFHSNKGQGGLVLQRHRHGRVALVKGAAALSSQLCIPATLINPGAGTEVDPDQHQAGLFLVSTHVPSDLSGISTNWNATNQLIKGGDSWEVDYKPGLKA